MPFLSHFKSLREIPLPHKPGRQKTKGTIQNDDRDPEPQGNKTKSKSNDARTQKVDYNSEEGKRKLKERQYTVWKFAMPTRA
jgi:hypothetical protein